MAKSFDFTHDTVGRINVEPGKNSVTLYLHMWGIRPDAVLALTEAEKLVEKLQAAIDKMRGAQAADDDFSDLV